MQAMKISIFQIIQHRSPEFRAFILADPHSEHRFPAFEIDAYRYVNSFFHYLTFTANMITSFTIHETSVTRRKNVIAIDFWLSV